MTGFLKMAALLAIVATPAVAQQAAVDAAKAPAAAAPAKPKKVCRTFEVTGRRISQTQCYTAEQWAEYDRTNGEAANALIDGVRGFAAKGNLQGSSSGGLSTGAMFGLGPS